VVNSGKIEKIESKIYHSYLQTGEYPPNAFRMINQRITENPLQY